MARILVVDDEWMVRESIAAALSRDGHSAQLAADGHSAVEAARADNPDVVILDLRLPDVNGIDVIRALRPKYANPILVCSSVDGEAARVRALDAGADDFLTKPFGMEELRARLRAILRRGSDTSTGPQYGGRLMVSLADHELSVDGESQRLTPIEWRLLELFLSRPGRLLTHGWLIAQIWGPHHGDETRQTLRTHVRTLRRKLSDSAERPQYIANDPSVGYRWLVTMTSERPDRPDRPEPSASLVGLAMPDEEVPSGTDGVGHDLDNVLTAMRFAVYLLRHDLAGADAVDDAPEPDSTSVLVGRLSELVDRAQELSILLRRPRHEGSER